MRRRDGYNGRLSPWVAAVSIAVLVATVPLCWVYRVLQSLPDPLVLSHRRWPLWANLAIVVVATATTAFFLRRIYYADGPPTDPVVDSLRFAIAASSYILAFVLLIRQHVGLYPQFLVAAGRGGFTMRKRLYQNVVRLEEVRESGGETEVRIFLRSRERLMLSLPSRDLPRLYTLIDESKTDP